jgi:hypothetical protein
MEEPARKLKVKIRDGTKGVGICDLSCFDVVRPDVSPYKGRRSVRTYSWC